MTPATVIAAGIGWRVFGSRRSGATLLQAFAGDDEQNRMLAGISLVRAGQRSIDLVREKLDSGEATPAILRLLPDIDPEQARELLDGLTSGDDEVAATARECIGLLDRMAACNGDQG